MLNNRDGMPAERRRTNTRLHKPERKNQSFLANPACAAESKFDCNASNAYFPAMSTTLTIRNLDENVKLKLRLRAASHQRSMEAEAREILAAALATGETLLPPSSPQEMRERLKAVSGIWKDRLEGKTTDEIMKELRGDD